MASSQEDEEERYAAAAAAQQLGFGLLSALLDEFESAKRDGLVVEDNDTGNMTNNDELGNMTNNDELNARLLAVSAEQMRSTATAERLGVISQAGGAEVVAAAERLGAMSLQAGGSAEREDAAAKNGTSTPTKIKCSACETEGDALKKCNGCKCVWYCDKKCQNKHRKEHKKECKRIQKELDKRGGKLDLGKELDIGPLGKLPPREECPICMCMLPLHEKLSTYHTCCGKRICGGCDFRDQIQNEKRAEREQIPVPPRTCAFCRAAPPASDEILLTQLRKRVQLKDPIALHHMAMHYGEGDFGLPVDQAKCVELNLEASDLGSIQAQYQLGNFHHNGTMGLNQDENEGNKWWEKAAEGGHLTSRNNLASAEEDNGDYAAALRHWRLAASGGAKHSVDCLITCFEYGLLRHRDLAESLQATYVARAEMRSEDRDQYIKDLKSTGDYQEEYDFLRY